ncbi:MAG: efflux transporter outer membrane subunit [Verrucomicrobiia bacterium]|jgi:NodT family efflux transporter outer membrane factor (OMF) lipoprotein
MKTIIALACLALFAGCSFAPKYAKPSVQTPAAFKELTPEQSKEIGGWKTAEPKDDVIRGQWWEMFHEPELNAFEGQVVVSNQTVAAALANFLAARAMVKQARSQYFPTVSASPSVTRLRQSSVSSSPTSSTFTEYSLPFDASWELDFWGRIRNTVKANSLEAQAALADLENVRLTVQAEVAVDYFQLRVLDAQKQLLDATVLAYQESLKLTQAQYDAGLASGQDVAQAETQLNTTLAQATDLGIQRALLEHAIAMLLGQPASSFSIATDPLTAKPVAIPFGVPSQLLERRPDVAAAERRVAEANAQIGVARAAYFPTITLSGSAGYQSTSIENLFSGPGLVWSVGATMAQTLFDGGLRRAVTEQARAKYQGTVANYRQTVLTVFQEVEDNLSTLRILSQELQQQNAAVESSQSYLTLANARYQSGLDIYLDVIAAQTALLSNQRTALNLRMQQLTASVQLIKALGGGWDVSHGTTAAIP